MRAKWKARYFAAEFAALTFLIGTVPTVHGQEPSVVTVQLRRSASSGDNKASNSVKPPAALWLVPLNPGGREAAPAIGRTYTLLQKNKEFSPHLLIVPVGSVVQFPNADPFFHNVFSLFDGRRFDLGLYEAGSTRTVTFGREGISYIFCNIHPEMSAVVIALSTPYFAVADTQKRFRIQDVPAGDYLLHVWEQGEDQAVLNALTRKVHISAGHSDLGAIDLPHSAPWPESHENKYGQPYDTRETPIY